MTSSMTVKKRPYLDRPAKEDYINEKERIYDHEDGQSFRK